MAAKRKSPSQRPRKRGSYRKARSTNPHEHYHGAHKHAHPHAGPHRHEGAAAAGRKKK